MPPEPYEHFVTADEVAKYLGLSAYSVLAMARRGEIPAHPIRRTGATRAKWRFRMSEIHGFFSTGRPVRGDKLDSGGPSASRKRAS
jgi:excisionase family DNA binding protein